MSLPKVGSSVTSAAEALRFAYEPSARKKIAREWGVSIDTAKLWLAGRFPVARREELAARIVARLEERDALSAAIRQQWAGGAASEEKARQKVGAVARRHPVAASDEANTVGTVAARALKRGRPA